MAFHSGRGQEGSRQVLRSHSHCPLSWWHSEPPGDSVTLPRGHLYELQAAHQANVACDLTTHATREGLLGPGN